jgi:hypothetical protein
MHISFYQKLNSSGHNHIKKDIKFGEKDPSQEKALYQTGNLKLI